MIFTNSYYIECFTWCIRLIPQQTIWIFTYNSLYLNSVATYSFIFFLCHFFFVVALLGYSNHLTYHTISLERSALSVCQHMNFISSTSPLQESSKANSSGNTINNFPVAFCWRMKVENSLEESFLISEISE